MTVGPRVVPGLPPRTAERRAARPGTRPVPARSVQRTGVRRERHAPDYALLIAVVALGAIGILMVYSSSAMKAYLEREGNAMAIVGPQIQWAAIGLVVMLIMSRVDYRYLRLASVPGYAISLVLLVLVFVPSLQKVVGGSARWLVLSPGLPAIHPAEIAKLALVIYLAHWMSKRGDKIGTFKSGTIPFLLIVTPIAALVFREPDLGTTTVLILTAFTMFFVAGANLWNFVAIGMLAVTAAITVGLRGYQIDRIQAWLDPFAYADSIGFHTIQGLLALSLGGFLGAGLGESRLAGGLFLPNASNDFIFAIIGEEFGFVGATLVIGLFLLLAYTGIRTALRAPDTFGALMAVGITGWLCIQAFINIAVVVTLVPVTGITLPFISAGGTSLIISFAGAGVLLAISRETVARGSWNDAPADRGRRNGRAHLPSPGRRAGTERPAERA